MEGIDERMEAIREGATAEPVEIAAIGVVLAAVLRPIVFQPLPWNQIDALRAISTAEPYGRLGEPNRTS